MHWPKHLVWLIPPHTYLMQTIQLLEYAIRLFSAHHKKTGSISVKKVKTFTGQSARRNPIAQRDDAHVKKQGHSRTRSY